MLKCGDRFRLVYILCKSFNEGVLARSPGAHRTTSFHAELKRENKKGETLQSGGCNPPTTLLIPSQALFWGLAHKWWSVKSEWKSHKGIVLPLISNLRACLQAAGSQATSTLPLDLPLTTRVLQLHLIDLHLTTFITPLSKERLIYSHNLPITFGY